MNICVNGSRGFQDYDLLEATLDELLKDTSPKFILGGAVGADSLAELYASRNSIPVTIIRPDWYRFGKRAGILRNIEMIDQVEWLIAFWDGQSRGTKQAIEYAKSKGKRVDIVRYT
jgi:hypothetical protein